MRTRSEFEDLRRKGNAMRMQMLSSMKAAIELGPRRQHKLRRDVARLYFAA
jgi:hypothetical protein